MTVKTAVNGRDVVNMSSQRLRNDSSNDSSNDSW